MIIETERLILRPFEDDDVEDFAEINADVETMRYFERPLSFEETEAAILRYQNMVEDYGFGFLAAELVDTGEMIGTIGLGQFHDHVREAIPGHPQVEIGWRLRRNAWGRGLAPEGAAACLEYAFEALKLDRVVAITAEINAPSRRVMEKIGMERVPEADFIHPNLPKDHRLQPHILYRINAEDWTW